MDTLTKVSFSIFQFLKSKDHCANFNFAWSSKFIGSFNTGKSYNYDVNDYI